MKVLVITSLYPNPVKPIFGNFVRERIRRLKGHAEIKVLAPVPIACCGTKEHEVPKVEYRDTLEVHHPRFVVIPKVLKWTDGVLFALSIVGTCLRLKRSFDPDIIDAHWAYPDGFAAYLIGRILRRPVVVTVRGSDVNVFMEERIRGYLIRCYLRRVSKVIAVSSALKERLRQHGIPPERVVVIRNGVDTTEFSVGDLEEARKELGLDPRGKIVLYVGNLVPIKGADILLDAFSSIHDPENRLIFVGNGPMRQAMEQKIRRLPAEVSRRIMFVGAQSRELIPVWITAADVLCIPSRNEGLPNVALEAMACGRPVVATRVGGIEEIITTPEVGIIAPSENGAALAQALDRALCAKWNSQVIRQHAERFSWDESVAHCGNTWSEVVGINKQPKEKKVFP
jgi:glycosyltransferase involved in cell wall biosynthesis